MPLSKSCAEALATLQADDAMLRTNDHYFSLTDQMNMGVRSVELDTHQVEVNALHQLIFRFNGLL